ncbi:hypothetical protein P0O15_03005 [Methanotrichaceae archaeon Mx]|uniref:Type II toxin-antitoxin system VapC family toxin n=1 Tax=Candidatus Methanocrinis natronophilus TaxID=3033396 RepID=A0ABT5X620_9EURY|nr:hypothetical protein [Candidatus Methanocrinis natronophilus]
MIRVSEKRRFDGVTAAISLVHDREMVTGDLRFREVAGIKEAGW